MRIREIRITTWRHFTNIGLSLDENAALVCIVGANGTGKSHLLELIASCAHRLGLSQGIEIPRGDPFSDAHDFSLTFYLALGVSTAVDQGLATDPSNAAWDRTLTIRSQRLPDIHQTIITAGGIADANQQSQFAARVIERLQQSQSVHFLSLDADRAYPKKNLNLNEVAQAYEIDWAGLEYTRGRSFRTTTTLYDEWMKYFLAQENQSGTRLMQTMRRAKKSGAEPPQFEDHFEGYAASLQKVLPHVFFTGVDSRRRTLLFDTTGLELTFNQLSGGEREIAFLVGQIDRFGLRQGLFLLDEPELHLNADLIRTWVAYLTGTVATGQIWLATHSLEAVEAAGQHATFVLERNEESRQVDGLARLDSRPVLSALSRAVGTPAFSISQLLFVFVEGEEGVGERERFRQLAGSPQHVRFMECGSSHDVLRRVSTIKALATEAEAGIRIGGVIDRDFLSDADAQAHMERYSVLVLPVHEAENFFLHPPTLNVILRQNGRQHLVARDLIRRAADARAGSWIFQDALGSAPARSLPAIGIPAKERAKAATWAQFDADSAGVIQGIVALAGYEEDDEQRLKRLLEIALTAYTRARDEEDLWKHCEGKQILNDIARDAGFAGTPALMQATFATWSRGGKVIPTELLAFREYLRDL